MALDHCTGQPPCWEHYQGAYAFVREQDIALALALMRIVAQLGDPQRTRDAADAVISLRARQWREMTRGVAPVRASATTKAQAIADALKELGL